MEAKDYMQRALNLAKMAFARDVADHVIFMDDGKILEQGAVEEVYANPKTEYTKLLLEAANMDDDLKNI